MIATSLAAALAVIAPTPQDALPGQPVPYSAVSQSVPGYSPTYQGRVLDDQDTALFRQGLAAARAREATLIQLDADRDVLDQLGAVLAGGSVSL